MQHQKKSEKQMKIGMFNFFVKLKFLAKQWPRFPWAVHSLILKRTVPFRKGMSSSGHHRPNPPSGPHSPSFQLPETLEFEILAVITGSQGLSLTLNGKGILWLSQKQEAAMLFVSMTETKQIFLSFACPTPSSTSF